MKKSFFAAAVAALGCGTLYAAPDVNINALPGDSISFTRCLIGERPLRDSIIVADQNGKATIVIGEAPAKIQAYSHRLGDVVTIYAASGEELSVSMGEAAPVVVSGSELMEIYVPVSAQANKILHEAIELQRDGKQEEAFARYQDMLGVITAAVSANLDNPASIALLNDLGTDAQSELIDKITPAARESILRPLYDNMVASVQAYKEREAAKEKIKVGQPAPAFTLVDENGKPVSLSDFKGKWVMLDFWGTWCGWCIKGIPQMKEEYDKAGDNVVYVSIACNDPKDKWLEAIKKYEMNWVNLYSDNDTPAAERVQTLYAIEGFPTKFLIDPEGNFAHICVGEQPSFYDDINAIINK